MEEAARPGEVQDGVVEVEAELEQAGADQDIPPAGAGQVGEAARQLLEGNRIDLRPFTNAVVPGPVPGPPPEDAEGWSQIDMLGAWECAVSFIVPMEEVLGPYRKVWGSALATVLRRANLALAAGSQPEVNRALKWLLALPKLLLREPRRGWGLGQGSGELVARFEAVRQGS